MPKAATYRLAWLNSREAYVLSESHSGQVLPVPPGSHAWFAWLETIRSFTFRGQHGQLTVRQEHRPCGGTYWYGYHRDGEKMRKRYLGRTCDLTLAHLEEVAVQLVRAHALQEFFAHDLSGKSQLHQPHSRDLFQSETVAASMISPEITDSCHPLQFVAKVRIPRLRAQLVHRPHLIEQLQQGMGTTLLLVSAPTGFGKTTLLTQWLAERSTPVAWLSLAPDDNEPVRFFSSLIAALQQLDPQLGRAALPLLNGPQPAPLEHMLTRLANDITDNHPEDFALVLDDYHVITADAIGQAMTFFVDYLPPQMHLVLATRTDPPLPLARLRAHGQLCEMRTANLRFSAEEASTFLSTVMELALSYKHIVDLTHRTEGWIAGLQLAALSLRDRTDVSSFLTTFTGGHRFVQDYLTEEVLTRQSPQVRVFLLHTCLLERLTGPLCDAVTKQEGSQAMLELLEQTNLFVIPLDEERRWYRYHQLFAEMLQSHLQHHQPLLVPELYRRASAWYEQQDMRFEAVQSALAVPDVERAARLIEQLTLVEVYRERIPTALGWLSQLPDALVRTSARLCLSHAVWLMFTQQLEAATDRLKHVEEAIQSDISTSEQQEFRSQVALIRANLARFAGDLPSCIALSQEALSKLSEAEPFWRPMARMHVAQSYLLSGDVRPATERLLAEVASEAQAAKNGLAYFMSIMSLAHVQKLQGRLHQAARTYERVRQLVSSDTPAYAFAQGDLRREWHDLEEAEHLISEGMEMKRSFTAAIGALQAYEALARLKLARGDGSSARAVLEAFKQLADTRHFVPSVLARATALEAQVALTQGKLTEALSWAKECGLSLQDEEISYPREQEYLILAQVSIAEGRQNHTGPLLQDTLHLLDRLLKEAQNNARMSSVLEILIVRTLALRVQHDRKGALATLEWALTLAEPEGYIHLFIDKGVPMLALLREARTCGLKPAYVATLLSAGGEPDLSPATLHASHASVLIEPLTEREREVLHLLAQGASNREIANRLVLSLGTVKKYVSTICSKLGVQSRTQAIARARTLHLL
jgi:LuxR family transcriptional regulator, maltose regulon positive regulatory protein